MSKVAEWLLVGVWVGVILFFALVAGAAVGILS